MVEFHFDGGPNHTPVGYFTYTVEDDHWYWSQGIYELHGYEPGAVPASTELLLQHKHPDDAVRAFEVLETVIRDGQPFSCYHRIIDAAGCVRYVLSVGRALAGADGRVEQVTGFFVDLTTVRDAEARDRDLRLEAEAARIRVAETRSLVDQAKGIVMVALGCGSDEAFAFLRRHAGTTDLRLLQLAGRLVDEVGARPLPGSDGGRQALTDLLARLRAESADA